MWFGKRDIGGDIAILLPVSLRCQTFVKISGTMPSGYPDMRHLMKFDQALQVYQEYLRMNSGK
jgi:hypothetical protein